MCGAAGAAPLPFAVGVLGLDGTENPQHRAAGRLDVALDAYKLGYFLVDTVEATPDGAGYQALSVLVARTDADALVVRGPADVARLEALAEQWRVVVRRCPAE